MSLKANLRVCASCEWIYKGNNTLCPKCGFVSYSARYVYGAKAYQYSVTQEPWLKKKEDQYHFKLLKEIEDTNPIKKKRPFNVFIHGFDNNKGF